MCGARHVAVFQFYGCVQIQAIEYNKINNFILNLFQPQNSRTIYFLSETLNSIGLIFYLGFYILLRLKFLIFFLNSWVFVWFKSSSFSIIFNCQVQNQAFQIRTSKINSCSFKNQQIAINSKQQEFQNANTSNQITSATLLWTKITLTVFVKCRILKKSVECHMYAVSSSAIFLYNCEIDHMKSNNRT